MSHSEDRNPESSSAPVRKEAVRAAHQMVVAANPIASRIGADILDAGGSAVDAAIGVQLALNLVEPQSSGIGGGAILLVYDATRRELTTFDGRETAPAAVSPRVFLGSDGKPLDFIDAAIGPGSVGVPGIPRLLATVHKRYGILPWKRLFAPAIDLARNGFPVPQRLHDLLGREERLRLDPAARAYFYTADGAARPAGSLLKNPDLAATLEVLSGAGVEPFYRGAIAHAIVAATGGALSLADLAGYRVLERKPVCTRYRGFQVCGMGPPSSGGIAIGQMLGLLERYDLPRLAPDGAEAVHLFAQAGRLAFADRDRYIADPAFVPQPVGGLLDPGYLALRARAIDMSRDMGTAEAGEPPGTVGAHAVGHSPELPSTSHVSIVDRYGNAVSLTTTIEDGFGSRRMVGGFLLNNELTDFSFVPERDGVAVANAVAGGKRSRSSMSPTIVFAEDGSLRYVLGAPGGARIIQYVAQTLVALIDACLDPQQAVSAPHFGNRNGSTELELGTAAAALKPRLEAMGHTVALVEMPSGVHAIAVEPEGLVGGADPRREGLAVGR